MAQENIRTKLGSLKRGSEIDINGFKIKKQGTNWIVTKGDFYHRSFGEDQLTKLVNKLSAPVEEAVVELKGKAARKANRLAKKLQAKSFKEEVASEKLALKEEKIAARLAAKAERLNRPFKRNRIVLEAFNLIVQAVAYFSWFAYFFTDLIHQQLGENSIFAVIGVGVIALISHILYARQLGTKHRVLNSLVGFIDLSLITAALGLYYGSIDIADVTTITVDQILPLLKTAFAEEESISLVAFVLIKWVLTLVVNKK